MTPRERELLQGMGNCYAACHGTFDETVAMVAGSRGRSVSDVRATLTDLRTRCGLEPEFLELRARVPLEFPY